MPYLGEILLFLLPFAAFWLWRRYNPAVEPDSRLVLAALMAAGLTMAGALWYGLSVSMAPHANYVPAQMAPDGHVMQGHVEPPR